MKKIIRWIAVLIFLSQAAQAQVTFTVPCTGTTCYSFPSIGDYQIYLALKAIGQAVVNQSVTVTGTNNVNVVNSPTVTVIGAALTPTSVGADPYLLTINTYERRANNKLDSIFQAVYVTTLQATAVSSQTANANYTSAAYGTARYTMAALQFVCTTCSAADGVVKIMDSIDGTNYNDISGATITVASGTTSNMIRYTAFTGNFLKVVWDKGSNTTGTLVGTLLFKR